MSYILDALRKSEEDRHQDQLRSITGHDGLMHISKKQTAIWPYLLMVVLLLNAGVVLWIYLDKSDNGASTSVVQSDAVVESPIIANPVATNTIAKKSSESSVVTQDIASSDKDMSTLETSLDSDKVVEASKIATTPQPELKAEELVVQNSSTNKEEVYIDGGLLIQPKGSKAASMPTTYSDVSTPSVVVSDIPLTAGYEQNESDIYEDIPKLNDMSDSFKRSVPSLTFNSHIYSDQPSARRVMINNIYLREGQMLSGIEVVQIGEMNIVFKKGETLFKRAVMRDW